MKSVINLFGCLFILLWSTFSMGQKTSDKLRKEQERLDTRGSVIVPWNIYYADINPHILDLQKKN